MQLGLGLTLDNQIVISGRGGAGSSDPVQLGLWYLGTRFLRGKMFLILRNVATTAAIITAGALWDGTAGSGGAAPALDTSLQGSGFAQKAIAGIAEAPNMWIGTDGIDNVAEHTIPVGAAIGDRGWIKEVRYYLEGSTAIVGAPIMDARTSVFGYTIRPKSYLGVDGDALLTIDIVPKNGYIRRMTLPMVLNTNGSITRAIRYCDFTNGQNGTGGHDGTTRLKAWKTTQYALSQMTTALGAQGGIIKCAAGTYVEDTNSHADNINTRLVTIIPDDGVAKANVVIKWASRTTNSNTRGNGVWQPRITLAMYKGVTIDTSTTVAMWARQGATTRILFKGCDIIDSNGVAGPVDTSAAWTDGGTLGALQKLSGTGYGEPATNSFFKDNEGQKYFIMECNVVNYLWASPHLNRNVTASISADAGFFQSTQGPGFAQSNDTAYFNFKASIDAPYPTRMHLESSLTLATAVFDGTNTTITWSGSPTLIVDGAGQAGQAYKFLTGANVGQAGTGGEDAWYGGYHFVSQTSSQTVVTGDCSTATGGAVVGDTARGYLIFHCDPFQFNILASASANFDNIYCQGYRCAGNSIGNIALIQPSNVIAMSGTVSSIGTAFSTSASVTIIADDFLRLSSGTQAGEGRRVVSYDGVAKTGVLASAFSVDQTTKNYIRSKSANNVALVNSIISTPSGAQFQWQAAMRHFVIVQSDILGGFTTASTSIGTFNLRDMITPTLSAFGCEDSAAFDCIFEIMSNESAVFPATINVDNNRFRRGTGRGTGSDVNPVTVDANFKPTFTTSDKLISGAALVPVYYDGTARPVNSPVGAMPKA